MGYCINFKDVEGKEISNGVTERVLLSKENTGDGPPGDLTVKHYILEKGDILELSKNGFERQDYIISGSVFFKSKYIHGNSTVFSPNFASVNYIQNGETPAHIISTT